MSEPVVSVIIPVYNVGDYVRKSIESALTQTLQNIEIIIIDDGSTDDSGKIIDGYHDSRLIVKHKPNGGVSSARKQGYELSSGKYIFYLDADDYITPDALEKLVSIAEKENADYIVGDFIIDWGNGKFVNRNFKDFEVADNVSFLKYCLTENDFYYTGRLFKKEFLDRIVLHIPEDITYGEDNLAVTQLAMNLNKAAKLNYPILYYVQRPESVTNKLLHSDLEKRAKAIKLMCEFIRNWSFYESVSDELNTFIARELYSCIINGVDSERFCYKWKISRSILASFGIKQILVLMTYSLFPKQTIKFFRKRYENR